MTDREYLRGIDLHARLAEAEDDVAHFEREASRIERLLKRAKAKRAKMRRAWSSFERKYLG